MSQIQFRGGSIYQLEAYIYDPVSFMSVNIYGRGTDTSAGPLIYSKSETPGIIGDWNSFTLTSPIYITGADIWAGYVVTHVTGLHPCAMDNGIIDPDGAWYRISPDIGWTHYAAGGNWMIRLGILAFKP